MIWESRDNSGHFNQFPTRLLFILNLFILNLKRNIGKVYTYICNISSVSRKSMLILLANSNILMVLREQFDFFQFNCSIYK